MHTEGKLMLAGATVYELMHSGWRNGEEQFTNKFSFRVYADKDAGVSEEEIARRLVACWNACEGIPVQWIEGGAVTILEHSVSLVKERDELLVTLRELYHYDDRYMADKVLAKYPEQP